MLSYAFSFWLCQIDMENHSARRQEEFGDGKFGMNVQLQLVGGCTVKESHIVQQR